MPRRAATGQVPDWNALHEVTFNQVGYFTSAQAKQAGFSLALLQYYLRTGRVERVRRATFRLSHFPSHPLEEFVVAWLWSEKEGTFSHTTALYLHELSDALPSRIHLTLPVSWARRRMKYPEDIIPHYAGVTEGERAWHEMLPVTDPLRTLCDCAMSGEFYEQAAQEAVRRGLVTPAQLHDVASWVAST